MDRFIKIFFTMLAVSMMIIGTMAPAMAVNSKAYSFEDNLEVATTDVVSEELYVPGEIIVKFNPGISEARINAMNLKNGAAVTYTSPYAGFKILKIPKTKSVEEMVDIYSKNPNVEYATANYIMHATMIPNDTYFISNQWNFYSANTGINVTEAWDTSTGETAVVAILDTGIAYENYGRKYLVAPDLAGTSFSEDVWDFVNNDAHPNDDEGHGTHVAGTIAQTTNNKYGVAGVAFDCTLMPVKVLDKKGSGTLQYLIDGIVFATDNGADVISMSLSFPPGYEPPGLEYYINYAYNNSVTVVAAAGNDGEDTVCYPAAYDNCIAVGATEKDGSIAPYSNYGDKIDIMAPGTGILQQTFSLTPTNFGFWFYSGTSMATPHVAGVAALLIDSGVEGPDNIREAIENTKSSYNIVDAYAALNYFSTGEPVLTNQQPVADAGGPYSGTEDIAVVFDGSGSADSDGTIVSYSWDFGDGATGIGMNPTHTYNAGGTYPIKLVVYDGEKYSALNETIATITEVNDIPVANTGGPYTGTVGKTLAFDGSGSYDIDVGDTLTYAWDFGDGTSITTTEDTTEHSYSVEGNYEITLTVTDNEGATDTDTGDVSIVSEISQPEVTVTIDVGDPIPTKTAGTNTFAYSEATITITNRDGTVPGAVVSGHWDGLTGDIDTNTTAANGETIVSSNVAKYPTATTNPDFRFLVDSVYVNDVACIII